MKPSMICLATLCLALAGCRSATEPEQAVPAPTDASPTTAASLTSEPSVEPSPTPQPSESPTGKAEVEETPEPPEPTIHSLAIFATSPEAAGVETYREKLRQAAFSNAWIGKASCWKRLAAQLGVPKDRWVAGVIANSAGELDVFVDRVGVAPIFTGRLTLICAL